MITLQRPAALSPRLTYWLTPHASQRLAERTTLTEHALLESLADGTAVQLNLVENHFQGCVYELIFSLADKQFFVVVSKPRDASRGGAIVTILTAGQYECDRGPILPALLLQAARNFTTDAQFETVVVAVSGRLRRLAEADGCRTDDRSSSALPLFCEGFDPSIGVAWGALVRIARLLLDPASYARYCALLAGQNPDLVRPSQIRILVHYWDAQHNAQCLRLTKPRVPQQHLIDHGLDAVNRHPAFWSWMADRVAALGLDPGIQIQKIEAYVSTKHTVFAPIELDQDAPPVDNPAPFPVADFADSMAQAAC